MEIKNKVTRSIGRAILKSKKNSPHIFFALGLAGVIGSTILACRATLKLEEHLDEIKKDFEAVRQMRIDSKKEYTEEDYYKDLLFVYVKSMSRLAKLYGPSVVIGSISVAMLTGSHVQLTRRNAALTATLAAISKAFDEYRIRIQEELGTEKELELYQNIKDRELELDAGESLEECTAGFSPYARFFEPNNVNWKNNMENNLIFLEVQQRYVNHLLNARGHVFLNEVYDQLGFERSPAGAVVGWVRDGDGDGHVDFGLYYPVNIDFVNGNSRGALLDFNVDGVVYDKI